MSPTEVLALPMGENDANAATIRDYLVSLLARVWEEEESFSGRRPFGNSGWQNELFAPLVRAGLIHGSLDSDGFVDDCDDASDMQVIAEAIGALRVS